MMPKAFAHSDLYAPTPEGFFELKWAYDPTIAFFALMLILYIKGYRAFRGKVPVQKWQLVCFGLGLTILVFALSPPIDPLSDQLFFMHMVQHIMITSIGVPLIIFGVPFYVCLRGVPPWFRRKVYFPLIRSKNVRRVHRFFAMPLVALSVFMINYWFWHIPKYYNLALLNDAIHTVEHAMMAASAMYLWRVIIDPKPLTSPLPLPMRLLYLGFMMALNIGLSAWLTFADKVYYAYQGLPMPPWWPYTRLDDQQLGGLIMWVPGGFLTFVTMTIVFFVWAHREGQKPDPRLQMMQQQEAASSRA